jgi:hypothetical protein
VAFGEAGRGKAAEHRVCLDFFVSFCIKAKRKYKMVSCFEIRKAANMCYTQPVRNITEPK